MTEGFVVTDTPEFFNDICEEIRIFIDIKKIHPTEEIPQTGLTVVTRLLQQSRTYEAVCTFYMDGAQLISGQASQPLANQDDVLETKRLQKRAVKSAVFRCLRAQTGIRPPWGSLTGIRPAKLARDLSAKLGENEARRAFLVDFDVRPEKIDLAFDTASAQTQILESIRPEDRDVYIGIPFCRTRCSYCSFASNDIGKFGHLVQSYLDQLFLEMQEGKQWAKKVRALYLGGGTPSALPEVQFSRLVRKAAELFAPEREFCVEAGRPDSITAEKLGVMKECGVTRISINPQTLHDETLRAIGREHTAAEFMKSFELARKLGFDNINVDLIAGLPGEDADMLYQTMKGVLALRPENITVHTLAIKRASKYAREQAEFPSREMAEKMVGLSQKMLYENGYRPYYLYRQKHMMGNLENVGYSLPGYQGIYNIDMMEEAVSILAFGAGAISKRILPKENRIERSANVSDLKNYLERTQEMCQRKDVLFCDKSC